MAVPIVMPKQGQSVETCVIVGFSKKVGDAVALGDVIFSYETDKAAFELESECEGVLLGAFYGEGDDVACLSTVCVVGEPGEDIGPFRPDAPGGPDKGGGPATAETATDGGDGPAATAGPDRKAPPGGGGVPISPRARRLAEKAGVDYGGTVGTGPNGRIIERDIQALASAGRKATVGAAAAMAASAGSASGASYPGTGLGGRATIKDLEAAGAPGAAAEAAPGGDGDGGYAETRLSGARRIIASTMQRSLAEMAQLTLHASFDAGAVLGLRARIKAGGEAMGIGNVTLNDMVLYAVSRVLPRHGAMNSHLVGDSVRTFGKVHLGMAVDTPRGLLVPTVMDAGGLTLGMIAKAASELAAKARSGGISPDLLTGGTFTVSNLGVYGVEAFTPVINPPQVAILGVCGLTDKVRAASGGPGAAGLQTYPSMGLSLTFDHRAVDGAPAGRFLKDLCDALERFDLLLCM
ncbi:MAG: 2-oxo acid dehydrogenase subunit E2 [Oscillospiraceae bacterium]|nr:2-oxo acid dehydrogenase subunit E2 [Oscillospiraceae bacterium]